MANHTITITVSDDALKNMTKIMLDRNIVVKDPVAFLTLMLQYEADNGLEAYAYMVGDADDVLDNVDRSVAAYE